MDVKSLIEGIEKLLSYMFGGNVPSWLLPTLAWSIAIGLLISGLGFVFRQIKQFWKEFILPIFYDPEEKRQRLRRQRFADYVEGEIRRLNTQEAWNDHRFTELDAEVETQGQTRLFDLFTLPEIFSKSSLRREKSLSIAIEKNPSRLMLIEGDPGSGKSVALRHVAQTMAEEAHKSRSIKQVIPFYINLKGLKRNDNLSIDRNLIEQYVLRIINRANDRDVEEYLKDEFRKGILEGTWFFLFDSFDEIPDILSSTESDEIIRAYAAAISDFLQGLNQCRGVLASREYKGPRYLSWSKLRILPLSPKRRRELVSRTGLPIKIQDTINSGLSLASPDFRLIASNPMFLNLLCEYMYTEGADEFPEHTHQVFEKYVWRRLTRDRERILQRFGVMPEEAKDAAEKLAFCMTADYALGLNPTKRQLLESAKNFGFDFGERFEILTTTLEYLKLARTEEDITDSVDSTFTFSHRRFQEYFATSVVVREPQRVPALELLTNSRWRETAVVILQTKQTVERQFLIETAINFIKTSSLSNETFSRVIKTRAENQGIKGQIGEINWPPSLLHVFEILQSGINFQVNTLPADVQDIIDSVLVYSVFFGLSLDKKWTLGVSGIASNDAQEKILLIGLESKSDWLRDTVYEQIARVGELSKTMKYQLRCILISMSATRGLLEKRNDLYAQLARSESTKSLTGLVRILAWAPYIDLVFSFISIGLLRVIFSDTVIVAIVASIQISLLWLRWHHEFIGLGKFNSFGDSQFSNTLWVGLAAYFGFAALMLAISSDRLFSVLDGFTKNAPMSWVYLAMYLSLNLWTTVLVWEIYEGKRISFYWFPIYFLYPVIAVGIGLLGLKIFSFALNIMISSTIPAQVRNLVFYGILLLPLLVSVLSSIRRWRRLMSWKPDLKEGLAMLLGFLLFFSCMGSAVFFMGSISWAPQAIIIIIFGLFPLLVVVPWSIGFIHEYHKYYSLWGRNKHVLDIQEFINLLVHFRSDLVRTQLIKDVRQNKLIDANISNTQELKKLVVFVELCTIDKIQEAVQYLEQSSLVVKGFKSLTAQTEKLSPVYEWTNKQLDELCKLYEQIAVHS